MKNLTEDHRLAYQEAAETIKKKFEKQRTWKQRSWIIGVWIILLLVQIAWKSIQHPAINVTVLIVMSGLIAVIFLVIAPFGTAHEMNARDIEHELVRWIARISDSIGTIQKYRDLKKADANLEAEYWSESLQEARNEWQKAEPKIALALEREKKRIDTLEMALTWSQSQKK